MTVSRETPERWLEGEGEWRDVALELKREAGAPEPAARARMLAALSARVASSEAFAHESSSLGSRAEPPASTAAQETRGGPTWSVIASASMAVVLLGLLVTYWGARENSGTSTGEQRERAVVVNAAPTIEPPVPTTPPEPDPTAAEAAPTPERQVEPRRRMRESRKVEPPAPEKHAQASRAADPAGELTLLVRARRVLLADPVRTLALTEEHLRDYPHGAFSEEREVLAIEALVRTGEKERARARMQRFSSGFPNSTHLTRIRALLE